MAPCPESDLYRQMNRSPFGGPLKLCDWVFGVHHQLALRAAYLCRARLVSRLWWVAGAERNWFDTNETTTTKPSPRCVFQTSETTVCISDFCFETVTCWIEIWTVFSFFGPPILSTRFMLQDAGLWHLLCASDMAIRTMIRKTSKVLHSQVFL